MKEIYQQMSKKNKIYRKSKTNGRKKGHKKQKQKPMSRKVFMWVDKVPNKIVSVWFIFS